MSRTVSSPRIRILADDLTGALDCAAAFGAGVPVHLAQPAARDPEGIDIVATATRDVPAQDLPGLLVPALPWLRGADIAFKKVDSLLRGNTFDEVDWLARQCGLRGLAFVPAFLAQGRLTEDGQQWWVRADGSRSAVNGSIREALQARGWRVVSGAGLPALDDARTEATLAWVPDIVSDAVMDRAAAFTSQAAGHWLWCGSAGLAHALARRLPAADPSARGESAGTPHEDPGQVMLVSASHHPVSREQWQVLRASRWAPHCESGEEPSALVRETGGEPRLVDLAASRPLAPAEASALLQTQVQLLARHATRPRVLVVVGGDTLLSLCRALGANGLRSATPLDRPGWGCARMVGGRWGGLVCHTRSGAFGGAQDLLDVVSSV